MSRETIAIRLLDLAHRVVNPTVAAELQALAIMTASITEIDGVAWCVTHDAPWYEGDTRCNDRPDTFGDCVEVPLYRGGAG